MKKAVENRIDLERVVSDPDYRRSVIDYLNDTPSPSSTGEDAGRAPASSKSGHSGKKAL